jgi:hypothetical protein
MDQQGTSTPGGASAADPSGAKAAGRDRPGPPAPAGECCFGDNEHPYTARATDPQAPLPPVPAGEQIVPSEETKNQQATARKSRAESGTP